MLSGHAVLPTGYLILPNHAGMRYQVHGISWQVHEYSERVHSSTCFGVGPWGRNGVPKEVKFGTARRSLVCFGNMWPRYKCKQRSVMSVPKSQVSLQRDQAENVGKVPSTQGFTTILSFWAFKRPMRMACTTMSDRAPAPAPDRSRARMVVERPCLTMATDVEPSYGLTHDFVDSGWHYLLICLCSEKRRAVGGPDQRVLMKVTDRSIESWIGFDIEPPVSAVTEGGVSECVSLNADILSRYAIEAYRVVL
nr:hypothetical protein CFP56_24430 [Quercus suber]